HTLPLLCLLAVPAANEAPAPQPRRLTLSPAAAPAPALANPLLPELIRQHKGNAAPHYARASALYKMRITQEERTALSERLQLPRERLPVEGLRAILGRADEALGECACGALCEACDWEVAERLRKDSFFTLLPELQPMRELVVVVLARMRLELADGRTRQALRTASIALAMSPHVAPQPTPLHSLVGIALA